jgi:hypothetical protein
MALITVDDLGLDPGLTGKIKSKLGEKLGDLLAKNPYELQDDFSMPEIRAIEATLRESNLHLTAPYR